MKATLKKMAFATIVVAAMSLTNTGYAQLADKNQPIAYTLYTGANLVKVQLQKMNGNFIHIAIKNQNDVVVFEEKLKGFRMTEKTYDLSSLPKGEYRFLITTDKPMDRESSISYLETEKARGNSYVESLVEFVGKNGSYIELALTNQTGQKVKKTSIYNFKELAKELNDSSLESGMYNIALVKGNDRYFENLRLK
jgi:alpha-glucosidase (family GH31 glycosyl hydrolase)